MMSLPESKPRALPPIDRIATRAQAEWTTGRPTRAGQFGRPGSRLAWLRGALLAALVFGCLFAAGSAMAVLIATGNGTGNTTAPSSDPGFYRVGSVNGFSAVYARNGWVLTAGHVGEGDFQLGGIRYSAVPGSTHRFLNGDTTPADLIAFKLTTRPPHPDVAIADTPSPLNTLVTLIGYGLDRGAWLTWMGAGGWQWAGTQSLRWGTNRISGVGELTLGTHAFRVTFDDLGGSPPGQHEADLVVGDSGGGAFVGSGASAQLVGILYARSSFSGQPANTSVYGNVGLIVDLSAYRDEILAVTDRPSCNDGLDDDGDGLVDFPGDPGCSAALDSSERGTAYQCDNGLDDDGDLAIDFPSDSGCLHPTNPKEAPEPQQVAMIAAGIVALADTARRRRRAADQTSSTRSTR